VGLCLPFILVLSSHALYGQQSSDIEISNISSSPESPRRHSRIKNTLDLEDDEALRIYGIVRSSLAEGIAASTMKKYKGNQELRQFNTVPYRSSSHGNRYLNNYANDIGVAYGKYERAGVLP
jgi:hypothetical protein